MAIGGYEDLAGDQQLSQQKHICSMHPQPTPSGRMKRTLLPALEVQVLSSSHEKPSASFSYPLVNLQKAMENGHL